MHKKCLVGLVGLLLVVCFLLQTGFIWITFADDSSKNDSQKIIVSLGDSYASGEGIPPFYGWDKVRDWSFSKPTDWLAHRSKNSWSGMLTLPGVGRMSENLDHWYFVAASGATTEHLLKKQEKKVNNTSLDYLINLNPVAKLGGYYKYDLDPQLDVFNILKAKGQKADYVTVSIGGNDMQFATVMTQAALMGGYSGFFFLQQKINSIWKQYEDKTKYDITKAYKDIRQAAGDQAVIIVVGYPGLLNVKGDKTFFNESEAQYIDYQVQRFNTELREIVQSLQKEGDTKIHFVSVMEDFFGHEAYTNESYLNGIIMPARQDDLDNKSLYSSYSLHPNLNGAEIYADCVQDIIDQNEGDWSNAYRRFIYRKKYLNNPYVHYGSDPGCTNFGLHDFDGNGIPELVIGNGVDAHMDAGCHVYTYRDDGICYLGEILSWAGSNGSGEGLFYYDDATYTGLFWEEEFQSSLCRNYYCFDKFGHLKTELVEEGTYDGEWSRESYQVEQRTSDDTLFALGRDPSRIEFVMFSYSDIFDNGWDLFVRSYESIGPRLTQSQYNQEPEETLDGWKIIYRDFIRNETYNRFRHYYDELWFALHDLDDDGTPELIYTDGGEWNEYDYIVCTIRDGSVVCIGKMCAPLGAWLDEGFHFLCSEDYRYPGLFMKTSIIGYYQNKSYNYCGYYEIESDGSVREKVVEASAEDGKAFETTDEDLLYRVGMYGSLDPLRFCEASTLMSGGWDTLWSCWRQLEDHAGFDVWHAIEKSNVLDYISMTYDEVCALVGPIDMVNVEMDSPRHYLFSFSGLSEMELSFESDLSQAEEYMDEYGRIPASVASRYIKGTDRCDGMLVYSINAFGLSDINASDIGAEVYEYMPDTGLWEAHAEHGGCDFYFFCDDSDGSISSRCAIWITAELEESTQMISQSQNGWINVGRSEATWQEGDWYYYVSGQPVTGWHVIGGKTYYFHRDGKMAQSFTTIDGVVYFFQEHFEGAGPSTGSSPDHGALACDGFFERSIGDMVYTDTDGRVLAYDGGIDGVYFAYATKAFYLIWDDDALSYYDDVAEFGFYDIDGDGIREFYIKPGTCEADYTFEFYAADTNSGQYKLVGTIQGSHSYLQWGNGRLYLIGGQMDDERRYEIRLINGEIVLTDTSDSGGNQPTSKWCYDPYAARNSAEEVLNTITGKGATYVSKLLREGGLTKVKQSGAGDLIDFLQNTKNWDGESIGKVVIDPVYSELHVGDILCSVCSKGSSASDYTNGHGKGKNLYYGIQVFFVSEVNSGFVRVYSKNNDRHNEIIQLSCNGGDFIDQCGKCGNSKNVHWIAFVFDEAIKR